MMRFWDQTGIKIKTPIEGREREQRERKSEKARILSPRYDAQARHACTTFHNGGSQSSVP